MSQPSDCIFCKIARHEIPSKAVLENEHAIAFHDLNAQAPTHVLVIPKKHIVGIADATDADGPILSAVMLMARDAAAKLGLAADGYRLVANHGKNGGQSVLHLHVHVLGGRALAWPPG